MVKRAFGPFWCVSLNPAIDKRARVTNLAPGRVNRISEVRAEPGGKAAHVAMVLRTLGADPLWFGFAGGSTGENLLEGLRNLDIRVHPVKVSAETRVNLEIIDDRGVVTELLEPGAAIAPEDWNSFFEVWEKMLAQEKTAGTVIASGSLPPGAEQRVYSKLTELTHRHGHKMFLDTSGEPLRLALGNGPGFVKPNREEAELLMGEKIPDSHAAKAAVKRLIELGAKSAVVSLGHQGLVWQPASEQSVYHVEPAHVDAKSSVGSGDATVAAFAYADSAGFGVEQTLRLAAATGAANCLADTPGRARESDIRRLETLAHIEQLD
ncbi:MAG: 1-phosphofructokinase family hexose kinase [Acidobacteriota bacterium]|nr:1-phosphofructokinase family hexose kinase [Acidobacteriota bacterium]